MVPSAWLRCRHHDRVWLAFVCDTTQYIAGALKRAIYAPILHAAINRNASAFKYVYHSFEILKM